MKNVVFFTNIPAHYRVALIRRTDGILRENGIILSAVFSRMTYSRRKYWDSDRDKLGFEYVVLNDRNSVSFGGKLYELGFNSVKHIKQINPDAIITAGFSMQSYLISRYCRKNNIPLLVYSGETNFTAKAYKKDFIRKILRNKINSVASGYIVYGSKAGEYIRDYFPGTENIYEVINTIDTHDFRDKLSEHEYRESGKYRILFVGDLKKIKGVDLFLKALSLVDRNVLENSEINIVGDGVMKDELKSYAQKLGLKNIRFIGRVNHRDIAGYYLNCELFVLPSVHEPFGLVLVEAAIAGKPLVASIYCGGAYDLIEDGKNGFIVDPENPVLFANKLETLMRSKELSSLFGKKSEEIIRDRVNIDTAAKHFSEAIMKNING